MKPREPIDQEAVAISIASTLRSAQVALDVMSRVHDRRGFGLGPIRPTISPSSPAIAKPIEDLHTKLDNLVKVLPFVTDRFGLPLDTWAILKPDDRSPIGQRGGKLCAQRIHLTIGLQNLDSGACVAALKTAVAELRTLRDDMDLPTASTPPADAGPRPDKWAGQLISHKRAAEIINYKSGPAEIVASGDTLRKAIMRAPAGDPLALLRDTNNRCAKSQNGRLRIDAVRWVARARGVDPDRDLPAPK